MHVLRLALFSTLDLPLSVGALVATGVHKGGRCIHCVDK